MRTRRCLVCGSDKVFLWLGGSIGALYQCSDCQYVGPIVIESEEKENIRAEFFPGEEGAGVFHYQDWMLAREELFRT